MQKCSATRNGQQETHTFPGTIHIGSNVWIGANTIILPDVVIGNGCVIGAGSVVTRSMPDGWVCCGNPCKEMREIGGRLDGLQVVG